MGLTWQTYTPSGVSGDALSIAYGNGIWLISTTSAIYKETSNGVWKKVLDFNDGGTIKFINGKFYVLAMTAPIVVISENGDSWQIKTIPTELKIGLRSIAYGNGMYCLSGHWLNPEGDVSLIYGALLSTKDFFTWDTYRPKEPNYPDGWQSPTDEIVFGNNIFVTPTGGRLYYTQDGKTWNFTQSVQGEHKNAIAYKNGVFVSGSANIYASDSISSWIEIYHSKENRYWRRAKYRNGNFNLCGFSGSGLYFAKVTLNNAVTVEKISSDNVRSTYIYGGGDFDYAQGKYRIVHLIDGAGTYITEAAEPEKVYIKSVSPSSGFVDEKSINRFTWSVFGVESEANQKQNSAQMQWQISAPSPTTQAVNISNSNQYVDIPANTFPNGGIRWRVNAVAASGGSTGWSNWVAITTADSVPFAPIGLSPNSRPINGMVSQRFAWRHNISTGTAQTKFDTQYSRNGTSWTALASQTTATQEYTAAAHFFPSGALYWRVRTYNSDGVAGPWASATVTVQAAPDAPSVMVHGTGPRPTVVWQSAEQVSFQVKAGEQYDSNEVYGVARSLKIPVYLKDGETAFRVRVMNTYGFWSSWGSASAVIQNQPPGALSINTQPVPYGVRMVWGTAYPIVYIYRDGALIGIDYSVTEYVDYLSAAYLENEPDSKHIYQARGVTAEDFYTMSNEAVGLVKMDSAAVAVVGEYHWVKLTHRIGGAPEHSADDQQQTAFKWYSGRARPVEETFNRHNVVHKLSYSVDTIREVGLLNSMQSSNVVYKSAYGDIAVGIFDSFNYSVGPAGIDVDFTIIEVSQEVIHEQ